MLEEASGFSEEDARKKRICANCGDRYSIEECLAMSGHYFDRPYNFAKGCVTRCLTCWLGCKPQDETLRGNLLREVGLWLGPETHLVVMPLSRVILDSPLGFPKHTYIYPAGVAKVQMLNVLKEHDSLARFQSQTSGVDQETFKRHATIAFPYDFDWNALWGASFRNHMEFIRLLSEQADLNCLNLVRYRLCSIDVIDSLPNRAGQLSSNNMMAGALLYNALRNEGRIIAGDAFSHIITRGLGLPMEEIEYDEFPDEEGEVGHLAQHGLALYTAMLETDNPTSRFVQALALLEFLAEPRTYIQFKEVKKIIARYVAKNNVEYTRLLDRFMELTGKTDPITGEHTGYRTRIMHIGARLQTLIPAPEQRARLFTELDGYIRPVLDHMIAHSNFTLDEYVNIREQMKPFEK